MEREAVTPAVRSFYVPDAVLGERDGAVVSAGQSGMQPLVRHEAERGRIL